MCGIFGLVSNSFPAELPERVVARLRHRGPDAWGMKQIAGKLCLIHVRLAINDLTVAGAQPMEDELTGNVIVFNGEIYNFRELRAELISAGIAFRSDSDTEVLLKGYGHWGSAIVDRVVGMFAFAVWDARASALFLARDRMGEKPLYFVEFGDNEFAFCSELKPLLLLTKVSREVSEDALAEYFASGYVSTRNTIIKGIRKLPPAHWMQVRDGRVSSCRAYWDLASYFVNKHRYRSLDEACSAGAEIFAQATRNQLIGDVPLGAFLSGGVDSSTVVAAMRRAGTDTRTFSAGFDEVEFDERAEAQAVADYLDTTHTAFPLGLPSLEQILAAYRACDEPFGDTSAVPTYYLAQLTRHHVTVCLSGDGGDELFGGYPTYLADKLYLATRWLPRSLMRFGRALTALGASRHGKVGLDYKLMAFFSAASHREYESAHPRWRQLFSPADARDLLAGDWSALLAAKDPFADISTYWHDLPSAHPLDRAMYYDMKTWLVDDVLYKVDRMTMAHSLESRTPFLDHRVVEFAASLPVEYKIRGTQTKRLLKQMAATEYGLDFRGKKKRGFNAPASRWIVVHAKEMTDYLASSGFFVEKPLMKLFDDHLARRRDNNFKIMCLLGFTAWAEGVVN